MIHSFPKIIRGKISGTFALVSILFFLTSCAPKMPVMKEHYDLIPSGSQQSLPMQEQACLKKQNKIPLMVDISWTPMKNRPETQDDAKRNKNISKAVCAILEASPWYDPLNCGDTPEAQKARETLKNSAALDTVPWYYLLVEFNNESWSYESFWPTPSWVLLLPVWMPVQPVEVYSVLKMNLLIRDPHRNYIRRYNAREESLDKYFWYGMWNTSEKLQKHLDLSVHSLLQQLFQALEKQNTPAPDTRWTQKSLPSR